jgi:hypothetical protein
MDFIHETTEVQAKSILEKIKDGMFYGVPIDMNDINSLVVAAYLLGRAVEFPIEKSGMENFYGYDRKLNSGNSIPQGGECPKCGRIYTTWIWKCPYCNPTIVEPPKADNAE